MGANTYKGWALLEEMPLGWKFDKTVGTPLCGYEFITNGKSVVNGQKRALLKISGISQENKAIENTVVENILKNSVNNKNSVIDAKTAQTAQILARKQMEQKLLKDILFDLKVCEIEGWDKNEYISELKKIINNL